MKTLHIAGICLISLVGCNNPTPPSSPDQSTDSAVDLKEKVDLQPTVEDAPEPVTPPENEPDDRVWTVREGNAYSIEFPEGWNLFQTQYIGFSLLLTDDNLPQPDKFHENIKINVDPIEGNFRSPKEIAKNPKQKVDHISYQGVLISSREFEVEGVPHTEVLFSETLRGIPVKAKALFREQDNRVISMVFRSSMAEFDQKVGTADRILHSLVIRVEDL